MTERHNVMWHRASYTRTKLHDGTKKMAKKAVIETVHVIQIQKWLNFRFGQLKIFKLHYDNYITCLENE